MTELEYQRPPDTMWSKIGQTVLAAGNAVGAGAAALGRSAAGAYHFVDPDLRRQFFQAPLLGLMSLAPTQNDIRSAEQSVRRERPVLLVHGLGGHPRHFSAVQRYIKHVGGRYSKAVDLRDGASLEAMAQRMREHIAEATNSCTSEAPNKIDMITHSMGGIVARLALEDKATRKRVATLITMGTPHRGTHLARLADTPHIVDLRPGSTIVERLACQDFWHTSHGPRLIALWSHCDTTILPPESAAWEAAEAHEMANFTHLSYLLNPDAWQFLLRVLRTSTPNLTDR